MLIRIWIALCHSIDLILNIEYAVTAKKAYPLKMGESYDTKNS